MKFWKKEDTHDYKRYRFGYTSYAQLEYKDSLTDIYSRGFLPESDNTAIVKQFYEARSIRMPLDEFRLVSDHRRILRRFDSVIERKVIPSAQFDFVDPAFQQFCLTFLEEVLGLDAKDKFLNILKSDFVTDMAVYTKDDVVQGYVFLIQDATLTHGWFSFYAVSQLKTSFGIYIILREIREAQELGKQYLYLGTCYGAGGRYKTKFKPLEFWDGNQWERDQRKLKALLSSEGASY